MLYILLFLILSLGIILLILGMEEKRNRAMIFFGALMIIISLARGGLPFMIGFTAGLLGLIF